MMIAEKILLIINDIKSHYYQRFGKDVIWSTSEQDTFLLNCDAEIQSFLEKNKIDIHDDAYDFGITYGIMIIRKDIEYKFVKLYGGNLDYIQKNQLFETLNKSIYNYLTEGVTDAHP
jgi:hypothetical protein